MLITWNVEHGTRNTERGTRNTEHGTRNAERGTRNVEHGTWNAERKRLLNRHHSCPKPVFPERSILKIVGFILSFE